MADTKVGIALAVSGASQAQRDLSLVESSLGRLQTFASGAGKLLGGLAGGLVVREIVQGFRSIVSGMEEIYENSQKIGMSVEALSGLKYAAEQSGVGFDQLTTGLVKFSKAIAEARAGSKEYAEAIAQIGIAASDNAEQALAKVAAVFQRMPDGIEKTALAVKLFGRSGADMIPFLNEGADGLARLREEARALGVELSGDAAKAADDLGDNWDKLTSAAEGLGRTLAGPVVAGLSDVTNAMIIAIKQGQGFLGMMSAMAQSIERLAYFGSGLGGADAALTEADAKLSELEALADKYRRIRDGTESESLTSSARRSIFGINITEQIEEAETLAAKQREVVAQLREETASYTIAEEKAAQAEEKRNQSLAITVTATEKKAEATKKAAGSSKTLADAESKHAAEVERTMQALKLENVELTQGSRARYEMELATKGWTEAEREAALALYDQNKALEDAKGKLKAAAEETDVLGKVTERAAERMTDAFGDFFYNLLADGKKAFEDFGETIKNLFFRLLADLAAAAMRYPIQILLSAVGIGSAGTAQAAGGSMLSGLFGGGGGGSGGGMMSGLFGPSNLLSTFGGTLGGGLGALGAGLMEGGLTGLLGTAGNLLSWGSAGLTSGTMAGFMGGLGAVASVALPVIGVALAAISFLRKKKTPKIAFSARTTNPGDAYWENEKGVELFGSSPFGYFGLTDNGTKNIKTPPKKYLAVFDAIKQIDEAFASVMSPAEIERVKNAVVTKVKGKSGLNFEKIVEQRIDAIVQASDLAWKELVTGTNEQKATSFAALRSIEDFTKSTVAPPAAALSAAGVLRTNATELLKFAASVKDNVEAQVQLAELLQQRIAAETDYIAAIRKLSDDVAASFDSLYESVFLTQKSPQETYDYWKTKVNDTLLPSLATETDPEKIATLVGKIQAITGTTWGVLGADQGEQQAKQGEFLQFITDAEALAQQRLQAAENLAKFEADELRKSLGATMSGLNGAAANLNIAAANLVRATDGMVTKADLYAAVRQGAQDPYANAAYG